MKRMKYSRSATIGSAALDLDYLERPAPVPLDRPARPRTAPQVRREGEIRTRARVREQQSVSVFAVAGFAAATMLCILVLFSYVRLTELSDSVISLRSQLSVLKAEEASLLAKYESTFDLASIEEAALAGGMRKPQSSQIYYLDLSGPDKAVVYDAEKKGLSVLLSSLGKGFYTAMEYFK